MHYVAVGEPLLRIRDSRQVGKRRYSSPVCLEARDTRVDLDGRVVGMYDDSLRFRYLGRIDGQGQVSHHVSRCCIVACAKCPTTLDGASCAIWERRSGQVTRSDMGEQFGIRHRTQPISTSLPFAHVVSLSTYRRHRFRVSGKLPLSRLRTETALEPQTIDNEFRLNSSPLRILANDHGGCTGEDCCRRFDDISCHCWRWNCRAIGIFSNKPLVCLPKCDLSHVRLRLIHKTFSHPGNRCSSTTEQCVCHTLGYLPCVRALGFTHRPYSLLEVRIQHDLWAQSDSFAGKILAIVVC